MHKVYSLKFVMIEMWSTTTKCKKIVISLISNTYKKKVVETKDQQWKQNGFREVWKNQNIIRI